MIVSSRLKINRISSKTAKIKNDFGVFMIKKVVKKIKLDDWNNASSDLEYWLSRPVAERFWRLKF